ncbi:MAG: hypothetical protein A2V70_18065 [Planctomycetes bacterium RBG_13_63_9]|nr:MAG: hypothetical protein A2V70_18065 [Planctomycetes bacterium RBG_13_63_9]
MPGDGCTAAVTRWERLPSGDSAIISQLGIEGIQNLPEPSQKRGWTRFWDRLLVTVPGRK